MLLLVQNPASCYTAQILESTNVRHPEARARACVFFSWRAGLRDLVFQSRDPSAPCAVSAVRRFLPLPMHGRSRDHPIRPSPAWHFQTTSLCHTVPKAFISKCAALPLLSSYLQPINHSTKIGPSSYATSKLMPYSHAVPKWD